MWKIISDIFIETAGVFNDISFYLLFGLLIAGIIKQFIPTSFLLKHLGRRDTKSVLKAALLGVPLPLCSCSVLPTAVALKKEGASNGATTSFLISTPETGIDSISLTYALFDPLFTFFRPFAAFITAFLSGTTVNMLENSTKGKEKPEKKKKRKSVSRKSDRKSAKEVFSKDGLKEVFKYGYSRLLGEIAGWLLLGIFFAGMIAAFVPDDFFSTYLSDPLLSMLVMVVIGVPIYICATGSTPIAAVMIMKGLNPGAALVFLLVGPATNIGSYFVLKKYIEKKYLAVYYVSLIVVSLILGLSLNLFYGPGDSPVNRMAGDIGRGIPAWLEIASSIILLALLLRIAWKTNLTGRVKKNYEKTMSTLGLNPRKALISFALVILLLYLFSGFYIVQIGETAVVVTFGKVTSVQGEPGLYYTYPFPVCSVIKQSQKKIYTLELGYRSEASEIDTLKQETERFLDLEPDETSDDIPQTGLDVPEESLVFTGDENLVSLDTTCLYRVKDPYKYLFNWVKNDELIRVSVLAAMRRVINRNELMGVLVHNRFELTYSIEEEVSSLFTELDIGIELVSIEISNVHAPARVHYYFRDVASSMEDKERMINQAEKEALDLTIRSKGEAIQIQNEAWSYNNETTTTAEGEAVSFLQRYRAYAESPDITRFRLYMESVEKTLSNVSAIFMTRFKNKSAAELWLNTKKERVLLPQNID